jgi:monoamine oxidase
MRACIVGAGFAGLAAAEALQDAGVEVIVLEARDRVGGRVWSELLPNGALIERGAEFIEHYHTEVRAVVQRLGLRLAPAGIAYGYREPRGVDLDPAALVDGYATLHAAFDARAEDPHESAVQVLDRLGIAPAVREAIQARIEISSTQPAANVAADIMRKGGYSFSIDESFRVAGGNQRIATGLSQRLGGAVRLATPVEALDWSPSGVRVHAAGMTVDADVAVLTVPAHLMVRIRFDPPLPATKRAAFADVDYGHAAKLFVPLRRPAAPSAVMSVPDRYWVWTAKGPDGDVQPVASCFAGSAPALDALRVSAGSAVWLERLAHLRPDLDLVATGAVLMNWDGDPWIGASYSTIGPGRPRDTAELVRPLGALYFAGEHAAGMWSSTMEGALRSGRRVAGEILGATKPGPDVSDTFHS